MDFQTAFRIVVMVCSVLGLVYFVFGNWIAAWWASRKEPTSTTVPSGKTDPRRALLDHLLILRDKVTDADKSVLDGVGKDILSMEPKTPVKTEPAEPAT